MKKNCLLAFVVLLSFFGCKKDIDIFVPDNDTNITYIGAKFGGLVTDEFGNKIPNATVTIENESTKTDVNGIFFLNHIAVNKDQAFISVEKTGFFTGSRTLIPAANHFSNIKIQLLSKGFIGSFSANSDATIELTGGASIDIPSNSITNENGIPYMGTVQVTGRYLNPMANDLGQKMPGNLKGIDANDNQVCLQNYGMMVIELLNDNGQVLKLANEKTATLRFPIPADLQNIVPNVIPMWSFDPIQGIWNEAGEATQTADGNYEGLVEQLSFWSCNIAHPCITLNSTIKDQDGNSFPNTTIKVLFPEATLSSSSQSDSDGLFSGAIPANQNLVLEVISACGEVVVSQNIGPFESNATLAAFTSSTTTKKIAGNLKECDNSPINTGYILFSSGGINHHLFPNNEGVFSGAIAICDSNPITATGYDLLNKQQSPPLVIEVDEIAEDITLNTCDVLGEFISYLVDGESFTNREAILSLDEFGQTSFNSEDTQNGDCAINFQGSSIGTFDFGPFFNFNGLTPQIGSTPNLSVAISYYGAVGDFVIGTFIGSFVAPSGLTHNVEGEFKIFRDN